jgi:hypothetical protein
VTSFGGLQGGAAGGEGCREGAREGAERGGRGREGGGGGEGGLVAWRAPNRDAGQAGERHGREQVAVERRQVLTGQLAATG